MIDAMKRAGIVALVALLLVLAACAPNDGAGDPSQVVEDYMRGRVEGNADTLRSLSCAAWEGQAAIQAQSFRQMNAELQGMDCTTGGTEGGYMLVHCEGMIVTNYNGETREWPLGSYRVIQEDGEWRMCGEA